jgi:hypothetical protein
MADIEMLSVVAVLEDLPEQGLVRGQVGTVVENWAPGVFEVEFCDPFTSAVTARISVSGSRSLTDQPLPHGRGSVSCSWSGWPDIFTVPSAIGYPASGPTKRAWLQAACANFSGAAVNTMWKLLSSTGPGGSSALLGTTRARYLRIV